MGHRIENVGIWLKVAVFGLIYNGNAIHNLEADLETIQRENELLRKENEHLRACLS